MGISDTQIFITLLTAVIPAFLAFNLGNELNK